MIYLWISISYIAIKSNCLNRGDFYPQNPSLRGREGVNIFQNNIWMEGYIPSFSFLAPKLRVLASMGAIFTPNPSLRGGMWEGGGGGKYFWKQYLNGRLHAKFQLPSTKIEGVSLNGGWFLPPKPSLRGGIGGGGKLYFLKMSKITLQSFYVLSKTLWNGYKPSRIDFYEK